MTQFESFSEHIEVSGETVFSFVKGMEYFEQKSIEILANNGIFNPTTGEWYSQQAWLNAFKYVSDEIGPHTLYCLGAKVPYSAKFPADIYTLEQALSSIDAAYHMNHTGL